MSTDERKKLNKLHPDYPRFMSEVDALRNEYYKKCEEIERKYGTVTDRETQVVITREERPYLRKMYADIKQLQERYSYLYKKQGDK